MIRSVARCRGPAALLERSSQSADSEGGLYPVPGGGSEASASDAGYRVQAEEAEGSGADPNMEVDPNMEAGGGDCGRWGGAEVDDDASEDAAAIRLGDCGRWGGSEVDEASGDAAAIRLGDCGRWGGSEVDEASEEAAAIRRASKRTLRVEWPPDLSATLW